MDSRTQPPRTQRTHTASGHYRNASQAPDTAGYSEQPDTTSFGQRFRTRTPANRPRTALTKRTAQTQQSPDTANSRTQRPLGCVSAQQAMNSPDT
eukprot:4517518-Alexandrium_andersonii.AAC.1